MSETQYVKIYTGNTIIVQLIKQRLEDAGINPIIKDEAESGRLAGFASAIPSFSEILVHGNELDKAVHIVEAVRSKMEVS